MVFATPIDAAYDVVLAITDAGAARPDAATLDTIAAGTWAVTTAIDACP